MIGTTQVPAPAPRRRASLAARARGADRLLGAAFALSLALLVAGLASPMMTVRTLIVFEDRVSIAEALFALAESREYFLFLVVFLFSVVFPLIKIALGVKLWYLTDVDEPRLGRSLRRIEALGKWSMLDVFVAALAVVAVKLSLVSDVSVHAGIYLFTASVVLSILAFRRVSRLAHALGEGAPR